MIRAQNVDIHNDTKIPCDVDIFVSDNLHIGQYAVLGHGIKIKCRNLYIGRHVYLGDGFTIGGGGCMGLNSNIYIDDCCLLAERSLINCAEAVTIGKHVAFGYETQIWTHGVWSPVADGFPKQRQEPVVIGSEVWLPSRCQVLPGVTIGDNVVVGMGSLVNKSLPSGCLAVGRPARIIEENKYPKHISDDALVIELQRLCGEYISIAEDKGFSPFIEVNGGGEITFIYENEKVFFNTRLSVFSPYNPSKYAEDFRDYLRRNGFPFYSGGFFESITPIRFEEAEAGQNYSMCACGTV